MSPSSIPLPRTMKLISLCLLLMADFLQCRAADVGDSGVMAGGIKALEGRDARIESITAYAIPVDAERRFSYAVQKGRLHAFIRFTAGGQHGWTELNVTNSIPKENAPEYLASRLKWEALQASVGGLALVPDVPVRPAWTQMAIGLGAAGVEVIEKPQENDVFQRCLLKNPLAHTPDGRFFICETLPGWGIEIDEAKLRPLAAAVVEL